MSDSEQDDDGSFEDEQEEVNENMRVFLRLRPMNKLETSRRSKNCVELDDDDPRTILVDSPLDGEYDFRFDHVRHHFIRERHFLVNQIFGPTPKMTGIDCHLSKVALEHPTKLSFCWVYFGPI
jgi:hypothetical protein